MASPQVLNALMQGGIDPVPRPNWDQKRLAGQQLQQNELMGQQRNMLFQQQQEDRQRTLALEQRERQNAQAREALAGYFMTPPEQRGQYYQQVAPKFGLPADGDHAQIVGGVIQSNPGILGPELSSKILQKEFAQQMGEGPANVQEWEYYSKLTPDQQQRYLEMRRSQKTVDLGGTIGTIGSGGQIVQQHQKTLPPERQPENVQAEAEAKARGGAVGDLESKAPALDSFRLTKDYMLDSIKKTPTGGVLGTRGMASRGLDYQNVRQFENRKQQLSTELRTVFRIPGEGTLTDQEQAQYGIQLPDIKNDQAINEQILTELEARVNARMRQPQAEQPAPQAGGFSDPEKERRYQEWKAKQGK